MPTLSVCLITADEAPHLADCLAPFVGRAELIVVDACSQDGTADLARQLGATVYNLPFLSFSHQRNYALDRAAGEWVFFIDADERASAELVAEILGVVKEGGPRNGYSVRRQNHFLGRPVRHGGNEGDFQLRLFRRTEVRYFNAVHEVPTVRGRTGELRTPLAHLSTQTLEEYWRKLDLYTSCSVRDALERRARPGAAEAWLKPVAKFFWLYVLRRGFLDGAAGFYYSALSSWYAFMEARAIRRVKREDGKLDLAAREPFRRSLRAAVIDGERRLGLEPLLAQAGVPYDIVPPRSAFAPEEYPIAVLAQPMARPMRPFFEAYQKQGGVVMDATRVSAWSGPALRAALEALIADRGIPFVIAEGAPAPLTAVWQRGPFGFHIHVRRLDRSPQAIPIAVWEGGTRHSLEMAGPEQTFFFPSGAARVEAQGLGALSGS